MRRRQQVFYDQGYDQGYMDGFQTGQDVANIDRDAELMNLRWQVEEFTRFFQGSSALAKILADNLEDRNRLTHNPVVPDSDIQWQTAGSKWEAARVYDQDAESDLDLTFSVD